MSAAHRHRSEHDIDRVTNAAWFILASPPDGGRLYAGYWVAVRSVVRDHLEHSQDLSGGDPDRLAAILAGDIARRLEEVLHGAPERARLLERLPEAIRRALDAGQGHPA